MDDAVAAPLTTPSSRSFTPQRLVGFSPTLHDNDGITPPLHGITPTLLEMTASHRRHRATALHRRRPHPAASHRRLVTASHHRLLMAASHRRLVAASHLQQLPPCTVLLHLAQSKYAGAASDLEALIPLVGAAKGSSLSSSTSHDLSLKLSMFLSQENTQSGRKLTHTRTPHQGES